jgi:glycosyltransferase involved in cell wall biosynthesis
MSRFQFGYIIATVESRILKNDLLCRQIDAINEPIVIVNQFTEKAIKADQFKPNVTLVNSKTKGLSKSRNIALNLIDASHVMICDDDIQLVEENLEELRGTLAKSPLHSVYFTQLQKSTGPLWRATYESDAFVLKGLSFKTKRRIQRINSMEQILGLDILKQNRIQFNEKFGAGTPNYPLGEETLLSFDALRAGGTMQYLPLVSRIHPPFSSGMKTDWKSRRSTWAIYRRIFWPWGTLMFIAVSIKRSFLSNYSDHNRVL